jgi:hypothetical protein
VLKNIYFKYIKSKRVFMETHNPYGFSEPIKPSKVGLFMETKQLIDVTLLYVQ